MGGTDFSRQREYSSKPSNFLIPVGLTVWPLTQLSILAVRGEEEVEAEAVLLGEIEKQIDTVAPAAHGTRLLCVR